MNQLPNSELVIGLGFTTSLQYMVRIGENTPDGEKSSKHFGALRLKDGKLSFYHKFSKHFQVTEQGTIESSFSRDDTRQLFENVSFNLDKKQASIPYSCQSQTELVRDGRTKFKFVNLDSEEQATTYDTPGIITEVQYRIMDRGASFRNRDRTKPMKPVSIDNIYPQSAPTWSPKREWSAKGNAFPKSVPLWNPNQSASPTKKLIINGNGQ
jgi:hypothetical protein